MLKFFIKTLTGRTYRYEIKNKISNFKSLFEIDIGSYIQLQCLAYKGKILKNNDYINIDLNGFNKNMY